MTWLALVIVSLALGAPRDAPHRAVPASLDRAESAAEDIIDFAQRGQRAAVVQSADDLRLLATGAASEALRNAGVRAGALARFRARAERVARLAQNAPLLDVSLAANSVSGLMPGFYARFANPVPPSVLRLDYLDREARLRSLAAQPARVKAAVEALASTWKRLRARVRARRAGVIAARFDRHVRAMTRLAASSDAAALQSEAARGLELVDQLERVFRKRAGG